MLHPDTRIIVIVVGGREDPSTDEDATVLIGLVRERTGLKSHLVSDKGIVNRIVYHLVGVLGF